MRSSPFARVVAQLYDAALAPDLWPTALQSLTECVGAIGACYIIRNKQTGGVDWVIFSGPCAELKPDYVGYYSRLDPYTPIFDDAPTGNWMRLSKSLPEAVLHSNEWYNDFVVKCGIDDILGVKLRDGRARVTDFGIHWGPGQTRFASQRARLRQLVEPLSRVARLHAELRSLGWRSSAAIQALDQLSAAVILTDEDGFVIEMNGAAERIVRLDDGLTIRNGRLAALRSSEAATLAASIAAATREDKTGAVEGHILIGRSSGRRPYVLTVAPLNAGSVAFDRPLAMVLAVNPEWQTPTEATIAEYFRLSPAESRLAAALMRGRKLGDIAVDSGVAITTLRTQLRSILRKMGVERQTDLVRMLSSIGFVRSNST